MYNRLKMFLNISVNNNYEDRNLDFEYLEKTNKYSKKTKSTLDSITWNDLDMNEVFAELDYTCTSAGEEVLYSWLRNPLDGLDDLTKRAALINTVQSESNTVEDLSAKLKKVGYAKYHLIETMASKYVSKKKSLILHILLAVLNLFLLFNLLTNGISLLSGMLFILFPINIYLHYDFSQKYGQQLEVLQYLMRLLRFCKKNRELIVKVYPQISSELDELLKKLKPISKKELIIFRVEGLDLFADYLNITFLLKEISYFSIAGKVENLEKGIVELYHLIGALDAMMSIVKYRKSLKYYSEPKFINESDEIKLEEVYHPLIENPVSNTILINHDIAITGSNMSGKSTFLRTIGINAILSQSICTALAKTYESSLYRLITSISLKDTLIKSKSYFLMEAEAIKRMLDVKDDDYPTIVLIDEIFKGTNPIERYAASMEILNALGQGNTKTIVATHDLNILPELKGYEFYYFSENISSHAIEFNFKIHSGRTNTRNAIKILEHVKYPRELLGKIDSRIGVMADGPVEYNKIN